MKINLKIFRIPKQHKTKIKNISRLVWKLIVNPEPVDDQDNGVLALPEVKQTVAFIILSFI